MVQVTEERTDDPPQNRNNLHDMLKVPATERSTNHLRAQLMKVHLGLPLNQSNLHNKRQSQSLKIHHHRAAQAVTESSDEEKVHLKGKMKELPPPPPPPRRNTDLNLHPIWGGKHLKSQSRSHTLKRKNDQQSWSKSSSRDDKCRHRSRLTSKSHSRSQGSSWCLGDHAQRTDDHPTGGGNLRLTPQTGQDRSLGPKAGAGIPAIWTVAPLPEDSHLDIINDPTHQSTNSCSCSPDSRRGR